MLIAPLDLAANVLVGYARAGAFQFGEATMRALFHTGVQIDLHPGFRDDHCRDVASHHDDWAPAGNRPLHWQERGADGRMRRDVGDPTIDRRSTEFGRNILSIHQHGA